MFWEYPGDFKTISNKPGHKAEFVWGDNVLMLKVTVEAGSKAEGVIHTYEQISMVLEGSIEVQVANEKKVLKRGDAFYVPAGVPHGGTILETLNQKSIIWGKILRSNKLDIHPLFFGIYGDVIYHHGAGFREPISRIEMAGSEMIRKQRKLLSQIAEHLPNRFFLDWKRRLSPYRREEYRIIRKNQELQDDVFSKLKRDKEFYRSLI